MTESPLPVDSSTIYLDHAATTPTDPAVVRTMLPFFTEHFGNPSSIYRLGQDGRAALDDARGRVARVLGCSRGEVLFTSGATESNNLAMRGVAWQAKLRGEMSSPPHIITSAIEHHAVLHAAEALVDEGFTLTVVGCDDAGLVDPDAIRAAIRPETALISLMLANNEVGSIQPVAEIATIAREHRIPMHTDAVQAAGMLPLDVNALGVDLLSLSAHKFYGPKGVGVLYVRKGTPIRYQQHGGGQESGRRGGTENVPLVVGLAEALTRAEAARERYAERCRELRDRLWEALTEQVPDLVLNGPALDGARLPNNLNVAVPGVQGETILLNLDLEGVAASAGSACTTGNTEPSHVLRAMGYSEARCRSSLRFTVGRCNVIEQMEEAAEIVAEAVERVRSLAGTVR